MSHEAELQRAFPCVTPGRIWAETTQLLVGAQWPLSKLLFGISLCLLLLASCVLWALTYGFFQKLTLFGPANLRPRPSLKLHDVINATSKHYAARSTARRNTPHGLELVGPEAKGLSQCTDCESSFTRICEMLRDLLHSRRHYLSASAWSFSGFEAYTKIFSTLYPTEWPASLTSDW